jgi:hypothetical protein
MASFDHLDYEDQHNSVEPFLVMVASKNAQ